MLSSLLVRLRGLELWVLLVTSEDRLATCDLIWWAVECVSGLWREWEVDKLKSSVRQGYGTVEERIIHKGKKLMKEERKSRRKHTRTHRHRLTELAKEIHSRDRKAKPLVCFHNRIDEGIKMLRERLMKKVERKREKRKNRQKAPSCMRTHLMYLYTDSTLEQMNQVAILAKKKKKGFWFWLFWTWHEQAFSLPRLATRWWILWILNPGQMLEFGIKCISSMSSQWQTMTGNYPIVLCCESLAVAKIRGSVQNWCDSRPFSRCPSSYMTWQHILLLSRPFFCACSLALVQLMYVDDSRSDWILLLLLQYTKGEYISDRYSKISKTQLIFLLLFFIKAFFFFNPVQNFLLACFECTRRYIPYGVPNFGNFGTPYGMYGYIRNRLNNEWMKNSFIMTLIVIIYQLLYV